MSLRTNQKLLLMRDHAQQEEKREALQRQRQQHSQLSLHHQVDPSGHRPTGPQSPPLHPQISRVQNEVRLENPTSYHVQQQQKMTSTSAPTQSTSSPSSSQLHHSTSSYSTTGPQSPYPLSPDSPLSAPPSSASEFDEGIWEDLNRTLGLDIGDVLNSDQQGHIASTMPADMNFMFNAAAVVEDSQHSQTQSEASTSKLSTSCPPLHENDLHAWAKDRQKKDNHNKIERRRRYNINDRIKELGTLLPKEDSRYYDIVRDLKQNKGTILKASVDFLKCLKKEVTKIPDLEKKHKDLESENRRMMQKIQQLEQQIVSSLRTSEAASSYSSSFGSYPQNQSNIWNQQQSGLMNVDSHHVAPSYMQPTDNQVDNAQEEMNAYETGLRKLDEGITYLSSIQSQSENKKQFPPIKQEYDDFQSQNSSGTGSSLTSPSPYLLNSANVPYTHLLLSDTSKDPLFTAVLVKEEVLSPQAMDICN
ncbi:Transcription factor E3 [Halotydeus destructor]|nr:Transcription factor E3 [Halotydeus destructor]